MKNLLTFLLIHLVDHPEDVDVIEESGPDGDEFLLKVHQEDMGKVIGKHGAIIQSIRQIAKVRALKEGRKVIISLIEEEIPQEEPTVTE